MSWFGNLFKKTPYEEIAVEFGFTVKKVERDLPYFKGYRASKAEIRRGECIQYELRKPAKYGDWSLLQRGPQDGAQLDGFLLTAQENKNFSFLLEQLTPVAKQFSDEFFEFERKGDFLHVFWDQWGGRKMVAEIYQALNLLNV
jgi:hypothetical protein